MKPKPQKRHKALQPLSRDHHHGLLLSWKIRTGLNNSVDPERIWSYSLWFYRTHLIPHFELEEKHFFPLLGTENNLVKEALSQHERLHLLFKEPGNKASSLSQIEKELERHIRFEERNLFPEIQKKATESQLQMLEKIHHQDDFQDKLDDEFWKLTP